MAARVPTPASAATSSGSILDRLAAVVRAHPLTTAAVVLALTGGAILAYSALVPVPDAFKRDEDDGNDTPRRTRFADADAALPSHMKQLVRAVSTVDASATLVFEQIVSAVHELRAEGVLAEREAALLGQSFAGLARTATVVDAAHPQLSRAQVRFVLAKIGVADAAVADRIFDAWNTDGADGINVKEFLHAVVLVMAGSPTEKLDMVARIMDLDGDGWISQAEMARFLGVVYASSGQHRSPDAIRAQVERMYDHAAVKRRGFLSRQEFQALAHGGKFHVGETLNKFLHDLTAKFSESMGEAGEEYRAKRAAQRAELGDEDIEADQPVKHVAVKRDSSVYK